jgi:hypothetical protein
MTSMMSAHQILDKHAIFDVFLEMDFLSNLTSQASSWMRYCSRNPFSQNKSTTVYIYWGFVNFSFDLFHTIISIIKQQAWYRVIHINDIMLIKDLSRRPQRNQTYNLLQSQIEINDNMFVSCLLLDNRYYCVEKIKRKIYKSSINIYCRRFILREWISRAMIQTYYRWFLFVTGVGYMSDFSGVALTNLWST